MKGIGKTEISGFSDKGTVRTNNEDNLFSSSYSIVNEYSEDEFRFAFEDPYREELQVFAVFDGMGGSDYGEIASRTAAGQMPNLVEELQQRGLLSDQELSGLLRKTKERMEEALRQEIKNPYAEQPGTTCCGFIMYQSMIRPFWIGDSRLYLLRDGRLHLVTRDHTVAQEKIDHGLITPEEAVTVGSWHTITAYIGDGQMPFAIRKAFEAEPGDKLLLCTDGISDRFSAETLAEYMTNSPERFTDIVSAEIKKRSQDNATALMVELVPETEKQPLKDRIKNGYRVFREKCNEIDSLFMKEYNDSQKKTD